MFLQKNINIIEFIIFIQILKTTFLVKYFISYMFKNRAISYFFRLNISEKLLKVFLNFSFLKIRS